MEQILEEYVMKGEMSVKLIDQILNQLMMLQDQETTIGIMKNFIQEMNSVGKYLSDQTKIIEKQI